MTKEGTHRISIHYPKGSDRVQAMVMMSDHEWEIFNHKKSEGLNNYDAYRAMKAWMKDNEPQEI